MAIRGGHRRGGGAATLALATACALAGPGRAGADTISRALARAYASNPDLNQQRAGTRAADENVPRAKAGLRPQASATGSVGYNRQDLVQYGARQLTYTTPVAGSLNLSQTLFDGNRTVNGVRQAESQIFQSREQTRIVEQTILLQGATSYMDVLRDAALVALDKDNVVVLEQQLRDTRSRFLVGEVTRTDVAQSESALAGARSTYFTARSSLKASMGTYRRVVGVDAVRLEAARPLSGLYPAGPADAVGTAEAESPAVAAALHARDAADDAVEVATAALLPNAALVGSVQNQTAYAGLPGGRQFSASAVVQLNVPIYDGGSTYASIRQAKELSAQAALAVDLQRTIVRENVVTAYGRLEGARAVVRSSRAAVKAAETALSGVRDEAKVGQRTTLDVLIAQQTLLQSRTSLVSSQRDEVVSSYEVVASVGRLDAAHLGLDVVEYDPTVHFGQVKDKWVGLRTPDGH